MHANGSAGHPSLDIHLGVMAGRARVVVASGPLSSYPRAEDQRQHALGVLLSLPGLHNVPPNTLLRLGSAPEAWAGTRVDVDGELVNASIWEAPSGEWCLTSTTQAHVVHLAAEGIDQSVIRVRAVGDWRPYGLDLSRPQSASTVQDHADRVRVAWESSSR